MSDPVDDRLRREVKRALGPEVGALAPPATGVAGAVAAGLRLRRLRIVTGGALTVALVAGLVAGAVVLRGSGEQAAPADGARVQTGTDAAPAVGDPAEPAAVPALDGSPDPVDAPTSEAGEPAAGPDRLAPPVPPALPPSADPPTAHEPRPPSPPTSSPTSTAPPTTTTTTTTPPAVPSILVSDFADRRDPVPLDGATVQGPVHVFHDHVLVPPTGAVVQFWLDDPSMAGGPDVVEAIAPYDLGGTAGNGDAQPYDVSALGAGLHTLTVRAGPGLVATATFTVVP
ncbi:MAG: hypothetical protein AAGK32_01090 [Actinomycetota bacterium]